MKTIVGTLLLIIGFGDAYGQDYLVHIHEDTIFCKIVYETKDEIVLVKGDTKEPLYHYSRKEITSYYRDENASNSDNGRTLAEVKTYDFSERNNPKTNPSNYAAQKLINKSGLLLKRSRTTFFAGLAVSLVGGAIVAASTATSDPDAIKALSITGGTITGVGGIVMVSAFIPIGKAGIMLEQVRFQ